jgi:LacI family transcriptional regulator
MKITLVDIAREAGVSKATVSLVLNEKPCRIPADTQKRIMSIADEMGYKVPKKRGNKKKNDTNVIGVIYQNLEDSVHIRCMEGIETQASVYGYDVISCNGGNNTERSLECIKILVRMNVSGIILIPPEDMNSEDNNVLFDYALKNSGLDYLLLDQAINNVFCDFVTSDNKAGAFIATEYLIESGHKKIGIITGSIGVYTTRKRLEGYKDALNLHGIAFDEMNVYTGNWKKESGYFAAEYFHEMGVDAIFAMNDRMALGVYQYAQEHNLRIGEDLSVIGFDYSAECVEITPTLTSVRQEGVLLGKKACDMLVERILKKIEAPNRSYYYAPVLEKQNSVKEN